jgi:hypothetical protein
MCATSRQVQKVQHKSTPNLLLITEESGTTTKQNRVKEDEITLSYLRYIYRYCYHIRDFTKRKNLNKLGKEESTQRRA